MITASSIAQNGWRVTANGAITLNTSWLREGLSTDDLWQLFNAVIHEVGHVNDLNMSPLHNQGQQGDPVYYGYIACKARGTNRQFGNIRSSMGCK